MWSSNVLVLFVIMIIVKRHIDNIHSNNATLCHSVSRRCLPPRHHPFPHRCFFLVSSRNETLTISHLQTSEPWPCPFGEEEETTQPPTTRPLGTSLDRPETTTKVMVSNSQQLILFEKWWHCDFQHPRSWFCFDSPLQPPPPPPPSQASSAPITPTTPDGEVELKTINAGPEGTIGGDGDRLASVGKSRRRSMLGDVAVQIFTLTKKNFLIQRRATTASLTQLFIGVIFLALLRLMQLSVERWALRTDARDNCV